MSLIWIMLLANVLADDRITLEKYQINVLTLISKHYKCHGWYRDQLADAPRDKRVLLADQMAEHLAKGALLKSQLAEEGLFSEANMAGLRGQGLYSENWNEIPDPDDVVNWTPNASACSGIH